MADEEWARRIIGQTLQNQVLLHDTGRFPGMYDLRIGPAESPKVAIECVGAVEPVLTETWNVGPARGPLKLPLQGDWSIIITENANIKAIRQTITPLLANAEAQGHFHFRVDHYLKRQNPAQYDAFKNLGIRYASCYRIDGNGNVYMGMAGQGGMVDTEGSTLPDWVSVFLRAPERKDVLQKLERSGAKEHHVFVIVALGGATWAVESYLTGNLERLPTIPPNLPLPVTQVWIVSTFGHKGVLWNGILWQQFEANGDVIDN